MCLQGSLVALMSSDLMDTHEAVMKQKMMEVSKKMSGYISKAYNSVKESGNQSILSRLVINNTLITPTFNCPVLYSLSLILDIGSTIISTGESGAKTMGRQLSKAGIIANNGATARAMKEMNMVYMHVCICSIYMYI